jgi:predicted HTH domain antitoxin
MTTISLDLPDIVLESYQQNIPNLIQDIKQTFIIWEYTNGKLSLRQSADVLNLSYREFLELLWSRGISIDALNEQELNEQYIDLIELLK